MSDNVDGSYNMTVSLNVINHLGLNLYSNIPAVLSEAVANAWDADASTVHISLGDETRTIVIADDGHGMTLDTINDRFLSVGYQRRIKKEGRVTSKGRPVMGRKGIGKLSLFSVANEVRVFTIPDDRLDLFQRFDERHAFVMKLPEIKEAIKHDQRNYQPTKLAEFPPALTKGTRIELQDLKKGIEHDLAQKLRRRLARRFSVIGERHDFRVFVDGEPISMLDCGYYKNVQFLWTFGSIERDAFQQAELFENPFERPNTIEVDGQRFQITGWLGTTRYPKDLVIDGENLNRIVLMVRGRLAQEDLLGEFNDGRLFSKYLVGEVNADFLDDDEAEDITTTSRQQIISDDPRYKALVEFLRAELRHIANVWTALRRKNGVREAQDYSPIREWFESLKGDTRVSAERLFGRIHELPIESDEDKKRIFKFAVLAFEHLRYKQNLSALDRIDVTNLEAFSKVFLSIDDIEASLYHQIIAARLQVIQKLDEKVAVNQLEHVIRDYVAEHLWLLDPAWERATDSVQVESTLTREFQDLEKLLTPEERAGRFDIKYANYAKNHIVIEQKRPGRSVTKPELETQGDKYARGLRKLLVQHGRSDEQVFVVFLVGTEPLGWDDQAERQRDVESLKVKNMRVLSYQELMTNSRRIYAEYLSKKNETGRIQKLLSEIDASELMEDA